jgi:non-specific serine/threonine protein kinase
MSLEEAAEYALSKQETGSPTTMPSQAPPAAERIGTLTRREQEIALLVARGLSNRQVSTELSISERTAGNHVAKILKKLSLKSRTQIAFWVAENQLVAPSHQDRGSPPPQQRSGS